MRVSLEWLRDFVDFDLTPQDLGVILGRAGIEVEGMEKWGEDWILELEITPNRPDLLSIIGVAREISVIIGNPLHISETRMEGIEGKETVESLARVTLENPEDCPRYAARILNGVKVKPSPDWIRERLEKSGLRPVNNIVDSTNYTLLERGHPLHAFDYDKLADNAIHVRRAKKGEVLVTLDGEKRDLDSLKLLICDGKNPVALAGIMGGADTEISERTTRILIESAYFDPVVIRKGAKSLGLSSEASYRFERMADIEDVIPSINRSATLMKEIAGGEIARGIIDVYPNPFTSRTIAFRIDRAEKVLGIPVTENDAKKILTGLGFQIMPIAEGGMRNVKKETPNSQLRTPNSLEVRVPSYRRDCHEEIDLIEEFARIKGYDSIPSQNARGGRFVGRADQRERWLSEIQETLLGKGFTQISTISLKNPEEIERYIPGDNNKVNIRLRNPLSQEFSDLQTSLFPGIIKTLHRNQAKGLPLRAGNDNFGIFEIGKVFLKNKKKIEENLSLILAWMEYPGEGKGFSVLKGIFESLFSKFKLSGIEWLPLTKLKEKRSNFGYSETLFGIQSSLFQFEGEALGVIGEFQKNIKEDLGFKGEVAMGELHLDRFLQRIPKENFFTPLPKYPPIERDLSCLVDENTPSQDITHLLWKGGGNLLEEVQFVDLYRGNPVPKGKKSLTYTLRFRSREKTLKDSEVDEKIKDIIGLLEDKISAEIRK
jgi:phenylalanyl-tRNA synthetase beta chain